MTVIDPISIPSEISSLLSDQERVIVTCRVAGHTNSDIATALGIRHDGVKKHMREIRRKVGSKYPAYLKKFDPPQRRAVTPASLEAFRGSD
jgi:DNA-binding NarL/FixJ family response regulator